MKRNSVKNYYDVLGISKTASDEDIKKAYRELALQHHPDKGGDQEKMKDINEAYSVLSDPQERAAFDNPPQQQFHQGNPFHGHNPFTQHFHGGNINLDEILNNVHGFRFHFGGQQNFHSTQMISHTVTIDLIKALEGGDVESNIPQLGKRIKFELPPNINHGSSYKIRVGGDNNNDIFLQLTVEVELPRGLSKEKIEKLREILSPEVKPEEANASS